MAETITIGKITFIVAPEETPEPKPKPKPQPKRAKTRRPSAPQCTASRDKSYLSPAVRCSDGYYRGKSLAAEFEREKNKRWWQRL